MDYNPYATAEEERREPHDTILEEIGPGSMTKGSVVDLLSDEHGEKDVKVALTDLITEGELEEHPEINGAWRKPRPQS